MVWLFIAPIIIGLLATFIIPNLIHLKSSEICVGQGESFDYDMCKCNFKEKHKFKKEHQCK